VLCHLGDAWKAREAEPTRRKGTWGDADLRGRRWEETTGLGVPRGRGPTLLVCPPPCERGAPVGGRVALTAIDIYKLLPKTKLPGSAARRRGLAFAMQIAAGKASIDLCPPASGEAKEKLFGPPPAPPLPKVVIGTGEREVVLGDETVLFRHEKTFYHPTAIAVSIRDDASDEEFASRLAAIRRLSFERVGQRISVDLVALRCVLGGRGQVRPRGKPPRSGRRGSPSFPRPGGRSSPRRWRPAAASRPLLAPPPEDIVPASKLAAEKKLPLRVRARGIEGLLRRRWRRPRRRSRLAGPPIPPPRRPGRP